jgi:ribokinase
MPRIFNYGSCCIDHVYQVPHFVAPGETLSALSYEIYPGGKGLNQSIAAAKAGAHVTHIGALGEDGKHLKQLLDRHGVDTEHVSIASSPSGHAIIQINPEGENAIFIHGGTNLDDHISLLEEGLATAEPEDWLLIQNETSGNLKAIEIAKLRSMRVAFNMAPMNQRALDLPLKDIDLFIVNESEGAALTGEQAPERILEQVAKTFPDAQIVLTLGEQGAWYQNAKTRQHAPARQVQVVDTTGAGDTFTGFFLAGLITGLEPLASLHQGCAAAGISVERPGAATSIPSLDEVKSQ